MIRSETERPIPRSCTMDDAPAVHECFSKEKVSRYEAFRPQTVEGAEEGPFDRKDLDNRMAVVLKETGELIGTVGDALERTRTGTPSRSDPGCINTPRKLPSAKERAGIRKSF